MFHNKTAVITGAGSGIGRALALALIEHGCHLALSDVNPDGLAETAALARERRLDARISTAVFDVADRQAFLDFAAETLAEHGEVHIVINNAGVAMTKTVSQMSFEDLEWMMGINFWGVVHGTKAFLPHLQERGDGYIVNISSLFGLISVPTQSGYNAAKFAVRGFTESLAQELSDTDIVVSSVHPGGVRTNIAAAARVPEDTPLDRGLMARNFARLARLSPDQAARIIITGMVAEQRRILVGRDAEALDVIQRAFPSGYADLILLGSGSAFPSIAQSVRAEPAPPTEPPPAPEPMRPLGRLVGKALRAIGETLDVVPGPHVVFGRRLDPQIRALLLYMNNASRPIHRHPPARARKLYAAQLRPFDPTPVAMKEVTDLALDGPHGPIPARLYTPRGLDTSRPQPLIVWLHGGGFVIGSVEVSDSFARLLAHHSQCRVASIDYRLAPEHPFPIPYDDAVHAWRALHARADELGVDPDRMAVGGNSAGGNLAAGVSRAQRDAGTALPALQYLICPALDMARGPRPLNQGYVLDQPLMDWFKAQYTPTPDQQADVRASPLNDDDFSGLPPTLLYTAGFDPLLTDAEAYADKLRDAGVPVEHRCFHGTIHGFNLFAGLIDSAHDATLLVSAELRSRLKPT